MSLFIVSSVVLYLPQLILCGSTADLQGTSSTLHAICDCSTSISRECHNWNPSQWVVTETITVTQQITITVNVAKYVESINIPCGVQTTITHPQLSVTVCVDGLVTEVEQRTITLSTTPAVETLPTQDLQFADSNYYNHSHPPNSSGKVIQPPSVISPYAETILMEHNPTGLASAHAGDNPNNGPSTSGVGSWNSVQQCLRMENYSYTITFDDLDTPYIPGFYNLDFGDNFTIFDPFLLYADYTAPSPPFAAISYPSNKARITSSAPFDLVSMYVGCEYSQTCLIIIRGLSPPEDRLIAEIHVRVTPDDANWKFVNFSDVGFNQISSLDFEVLDLKTGDKGTLGLTLDQISFNREVPVLQAC